MNNIYLMCGCPAQGKSTWIKEHINNETDICVSRDRIRFMLVKEDEDYFSKEKEVLKLFKFNIKEVLEHGYNVWIDATFLTEKARRWIFDIASDYDAEVHAISFRRPLETCLEWNEKRQGREFVPKSAIRRMWNQFEIPVKNEGFATITYIN